MKLHFVENGVEINSHYFIDENFPHAKQEAVRILRNAGRTFQQNSASLHSTDITA